MADEPPTGRRNREVTELLAAHAAGSDDALPELFRHVYDELLRLARAQRRRFGRRHSLDTVGLVHDCYLKLAGGVGLPARDLGHFFALAARAMRHLLVDYARAKSRAKRRADEETLDEDILGQDTDATTVLAVNQALERMAEIDPRLVLVTECRYYAGLTVEETAEALGLSVSTIERAWRSVRSYLGEQLAR